MRGETVDLIGSVLRNCATGESHSVAAAVAAAEQGVVALVDSSRAHLAYPEFVACALVRLAVETNSDISALEPALRSLEDEFGIDPLDVGSRALGHPLLLSLPLADAVEAVNALLVLLAPLQEVSLWLREPDPDLLQTGWATALERRSVVARREIVLEAAAERTGLRMANISCWQLPCAALVFLPDAGREAECQALAERGATALGAAFERASLIEGSVARSEALLKSGERLLTRLGFDLHDGPLQDVAVLSSDLDNLRRHVADTLGTTPLGAEILAELEDAAAVAEFLNGELRDLAISIDGTGLARQRFDNVIASVVRKFTSRCDAEVDIAILGEIDTLTESQKITLTRVVQEALANIREHSNAANVRISIDARGSSVLASIIDDGSGFDVEEGMLRAGRNGRMGLAGMIERMRLLGGVCEITSQPGTGTEIALTIARWEPAAATAEPEAPAAAATVLRVA